MTPFGRAMQPASSGGKTGHCAILTALAVLRSGVQRRISALREASSSQADPAARGAALAAGAHRLQQMAEREAHVSIAARRLAQQQQPVSTAQKPQQLSNVWQHPVEDDSDDSQTDWEIGEADDADVVYASEKLDDRGRPLPEQQQPVAPSVPQPEPKNPNEATAMLSKFRPILSTPEDLQRLLEARADPNMIVGEGNISPMENIMTFAREIHVPMIFHVGCTWFPFDFPELPRFLSICVSSVEQMRELLLDYGAKNSRALRERWRIRLAADANDPIWLANFHHDPR